MAGFSFYIPTRVLFGPGMLNELATVKLPGRKALIVTTAGKSVEKYGYLDRVISLLKQNNDTQCVVFDKVMPNPLLSHVREAAALCRAEGCDFVIGLGGGSPIDSAKAIALAADYVEGGKKPTGALPIIAITTTAGTGTEADPWTVITHDESRHKVGFGCDELFPVLSIVDPELMLSVPAKLTAYQGFDAFFHASEGFLARVATPVSDALALQSMRLIFKYLPRAVADGKDLEARTNVALANTLSGMVESTSCCISEHSLEHAMSGLYPELPHGAGLIMISLAFYRHFAPLAPERFIEMARNLGADLSGVAAEKQPYVFVDLLEQMQKACGVDQLKMSDYGIRREDFPRLAQLARDAMGGLFGLDPQPLTDEDIIRIFEESYR